MSVPCSEYIFYTDFSGIVRISSEWHEESHGYENEHIYEKIACLKQNQHYLVSVHWYRRTMKRIKILNITETEITKEEYIELCRKYGGILDTDEYRKNLKEKNEILNQIDELSPSCPDCHSRMELKIGRFGEFWGCETYPRCKGTLKLSDSLKKELDQLNNRLQELNKLL